MITIEIGLDKLEVRGHAGYAKKGNDIVCAAISALSLGLAHSLEALTDSEISHEISNGYLKIEYKNLSKQGKLLIDSFFIIVSDIQCAYGNKYIEIIADGHKMEKGTE